MHLLTTGVKNVHYGVAWGLRQMHAYGQQRQASTIKPYSINIYLIILVYKDINIKKRLLQLF